MLSGELIVGQNEISHPPPAPLVPSPVTGSCPKPAPRPCPRPILIPDVGPCVGPRTENRSPTRHSKRNRNIVVDKSSSSLNLSAPIVKVFYVNSDGNGPCMRLFWGRCPFFRGRRSPRPAVAPAQTEIKPQVNERVLETVARKRTVIYSCGSFYTSILPCLIVKCPCPRHWQRPTRDDPNPRGRLYLRVGMQPWATPSRPSSRRPRSCC